MLLNRPAGRPCEGGNDGDDVTNSTGGPIDSLATQGTASKGAHGTPLFVMEAGGEGIAVRWVPMLVKTHRTDRACSD